MMMRERKKGPKEQNPPPPPKKNNQKSMSGTNSTVELQVKGLNCADQKGRVSI